MAQTAIVTGGTGGLGTAVVARLLDAGWRVVVPWIAQAETGRLEQHERLELVRADVSDPAAAAEVAARAGDELRGLVNLVGGYEAPGRVHEIDLDRFLAQFRSNAGVVAHLLSSDSVPTSGAAIPVYGRA
jgi:NAD(P)-dependent dehydrogenase (short-subunit alcohol dehydrogenase family)